jgi:hypothetical protein
MHEALAIIDMNFPDMFDTIREIYGLTNVYWGYQEQMLKTDLYNTNKKNWEYCSKEVLDASKQINSLVTKLQRKLSEEIADTWPVAPTAP